MPARMRCGERSTPLLRHSGVTLDVAGAEEEDALGVCELAAARGARGLFASGAFHQRPSGSDVVFLFCILDVVVLFVVVILFFIFEVARGLFIFVLPWACCQRPLGLDVWWVNRFWTFLGHAVCRALV